MCEILLCDGQYLFEDNLIAISVAGLSRGWTFPNPQED